MFQFHIGAIRSSLAVPAPLSFPGFQFHIGAIRSYKQVKGDELDLSFNSILVQLEVALAEGFWIGDLVSIPYWCN